MIALLLLGAVALSIHAVKSAPDGEETAEGFILESRPAGRLVPETKNCSQSVRGGMAMISAVPTAGN